MRACDCCFNRLVYVQEKENQKEMLQEPKATGLAAKLDILESTSGKNQQSSEAQKRMTLFGGAKMEDNNSKTTGKVQANTDSTMATMNETRQRLEERGEKLSRATERSAEMANQASEFAKLAKKLNEQQKSRWF